MNLDFRSDMALAGARAFEKGLPVGQADAKGGSVLVAAAKSADGTTATEIIATIVTETTKELAAAS
jgi:hypothetical protein